MLDVFQHAALVHVRVVHDLEQIANGCNGDPELLGTLEHLIARQRAGPRFN